MIKTKNILELKKDRKKLVVQSAPQKFKLTAK
jgi:hypothetical protein